MRLEARIYCAVSCAWDGCAVMQVSFSVAPVLCFFCAVVAFAAVGLVVFVTRAPP